MQFGSANVIQSNNLMSNGVLHIIDSLNQNQTSTQGGAAGQQQNQTEGQQQGVFSRMFKRRHLAK